MSTADLSTPVVIERDGLITVTDMNLDHDRLYEKAAEWNHRQSAADEDWDARRVTALEESSKVAVAAADDFRIAAGLTLTADWARILSAKLAEAADRLEQAEPVRFTSPMLRRA